MSAETLLFMDDKMHPWNTAGATAFTASSTKSGYSMEAVRDTGCTSGWRPNDGTSDEYLMFDAGQDVIPCMTTNTSTTLIGDFGLNVNVGDVISGTGIQAGTTVSSIAADGWSLVMSLAATATSGSPVSLTFSHKGWIGSVGGSTVYVALAYDSRDTDQTAVTIMEDSTDSAAGTFLQQKASFTLVQGVVTFAYASFLLPSGGKRYHRLVATNSSRGGGTRGPTILSWAMFTAAGVYSIENDYTGGNVSPGQSDAVSSGTVSPSRASGFPFSAVPCKMRQAFDLHVRRANMSMMDDLVAAFRAQGCGARPFFAQYEGVKNADTADFSMVRLRDARWMSPRPQPDLFEITVPIITEAHP